MKDHTITPKARIATSAFCLSFLMSACGGGGSDPAPTVTPTTPTTVNPTLSIADAVVVEGDAGTTALQFTITSSAVITTGQTVADASVNYATASGSATEGVDFDAASGTVQIPGTVSQVTIDIVVQADTDVEPDETLTITLSAPVNATLSQATATGTIRDDDGAMGTSGIDSRPDNQSCIAPPRPTVNASVALVDPYPSLPNLIQPTKLLLEPAAATGAGSYSRNPARSLPLTRATRQRSVTILT